MASPAPTRQTDDANRSPGNTESPDTAVMGPARSQPARSQRHEPHPVSRRPAASGQRATVGGRLSAGDCRRPAAMFRHRHEVLHRGSAGGPPPGIAYLSNCVKSQDALVRTSPERNGVAQVLCGARICRAAARGPAVQHGLPRADAVRNIERRPVSQTKMIEVLTMDRQYSQPKIFPSIARNFRNSQ